MKTITVTAHPNLALIKYWGKRDEALMLPTKSSLSLTIDALKTTTTFSFAHAQDNVNLDFHQTTKADQRVRSFLDFFREKYSVDAYFTIASSNNFSVGTGLASSSSGSAALASGLAALCNLNLNDRELSILARHGSGSAARSIHGGFVVWNKGQQSDGTDCYAEQIFDQHHWPELRLIIVIIDTNEKKISSRNAMRETVATSPSYTNWLDASQQRITGMVQAIKAHDLAAVGQLAEQDWLGMHTAMLDTAPRLDYWTPASYAVIDVVKRLRADGIPCFFTTDAGPNVFICCPRNVADSITAAVKTVPGVENIIPSGIGGRPTII